MTTVTVNGKGYNDAAYDATTNPYGFGSGGHLTNFFALIADVLRSRQIVTPAIAGTPGATAGWTAAANDGTFRLPASQTNATLVVPILGLKVGDTLTGVDVAGQVESAGANVTLTMSVRKGVSAAADITDSQLATDNVGTLVADTILSAANLGVSGLSDVVAADEHFYVLFTGTTAALTDIALQSIIATVTPG